MNIEINIDECYPVYLRLSDGPPARSPNFYHRFNEQSVLTNFDFINKSWFIADKQFIALLWPEPHRCYFANFHFSQLPEAFFAQMENENVVATNTKQTGEGAMKN